MSNCCRSVLSLDPQAFAYKVIVAGQVEQLVNVQFERRVMESGRENPFAKAEFRSRIRKTAVFTPFAPSERWTVTYHDPHCSVACPCQDCLEPNATPVTIAACGAGGDARARGHGCALRPASLRLHRGLAGGGGRVLRAVLRRRGRQAGAAAAGR